MILTTSLLSPINGIIHHIDKNKIYITTKEKYDQIIFSPISGHIDNINNVISIKNKKYAEPVLMKLYSSKMNTINNNNSVTKGQIIGSKNKGIVSIDLNGLINFKTVSVGSKVIGGKSIIGYLLTNPKMQINDKPIFDAADRLIILTTPHETCISNVGHSCDYYAPILAKKLFDKLSDLGDIILIHGNINRKQIDLNRIESRNTDFRNKIRQVVKDSINIDKKNIIYLIDCHSFPVYIDRKYHFGTAEIPEPEVTILFDDPMQINIVYQLKLVLSARGLAVTALPGKKNDIIDEFIAIDNETKIIPLLIEVREDLNDDKLDLIGSAIKEWILNN